LDGFGQFSVKLASEALVEGTTVTWRSFTTALQLWGSMVKWQHLDPKIFVSPIPTVGASFFVPNVLQKLTISVHTWSTGSPSVKNPAHHQ